MISVGSVNKDAEPRLKDDVVVEDPDSATSLLKRGHLLLTGSTSPTVAATWLLFTPAMVEIDALRA